MRVDACMSLIVNLRKRVIMNGSKYDLVYEYQRMYEFTNESEWK